MILNRCSMSSGVLHLLPYNNKNYSSRPYDSTFPCFPKKPVFSCRGNSWIYPPKLNSFTSLGNRLSPLSAVSSPLSPRASKNDVPYNYKFPAMTKKPRWWWRTLACLPYLMPLHMTCFYAETAYHLHPFLENLEFFTEPFLRALGKLPCWFLMAHLIVSYFGIAKRKEWPHFFRFHVVNGILLEMALQVIGTISCWMPLSVYRGKIGMHFWAAVAFAYLFTVLECVRCALAGMYADVPFVCDAAYIQVPYC